MILIDAGFFGELPCALGDILALRKRKIEAAVNLYGDGRITREEYLRRVQIYRIVAGGVSKHCKHRSHDGV